MFVSVLERFGRRLQLVWEEEYLLHFNERSKVRKTVILHKTQHHFVGTTKTAATWAQNKNSALCEPFRTRGQRNTKATLVFFHFLQVFHVLMSLWWLTIALGISLAPCHVSHHFPRAFVGIGGGFFCEFWRLVWSVIVTTPPCVARW